MITVILFMADNKIKVSATGHWFTVKLKVKTGEFFYFRTNINKDSIDYLKSQNINDSAVERFVEQKIKMDVEDADSQFNKEIYNKYKDDKYRRVNAFIALNEQRNGLTIEYS